MAADEDVRRALTLDQRFEPLAALVRDSSPESIHRGAIASVDTSGLLRGWVGDPSVPILLRSTAKPFQALAVVESGAAEAFSITAEEIAVMAGSHAGQQEHTRVVAGLLERCGVSPDSLVCGPLVHMCSGKHAGMVALALHLGAPVAGYERTDHPVQREIARTIEKLLAMRPVPRAWGEALPEATTDAAASTADGAASPSLFAGVDGCGVPVIRLPLDAVAWLYALLGAGATPGLATVRDAMLALPELVGGRTRFDTRLMRSLPGRVVAKGGAEGVQALAVCPQADIPADEGMVVGLVIKVEDGSTRPIPLVVRACLEASGLQLPSDMPTQTPPRDEWTERTLSPGEWVALFDAAALGGDGVQGLAPAGQVPGLLQEGGKIELVVGRGDEKDLARFLREEWPLSDEETFGRETQWIADPFALILKQRRKVLAVLKGHFLGGLASVDEFIVGRDYRSRGVGAYMLARFEEEARRRGCARVVLRTVKGGRSEGFYRRLGYERECVQLDYEFGEDFVRLMHRIHPTGEGE